MSFKLHLGDPLHLAESVKRSTVGLKVVGGTAAHVLGSKNTFDDFDRGLKRVLGGKVSGAEWNKSLDMTSRFLQQAPTRLVAGVGGVATATTKQAGQSLADVAGAAGQGVGNAAAASVEGLLKGLLGLGAPVGSGKGFPWGGAVLVGAALVVGAVVLHARSEVVRRV